MTENMAARGEGLTGALDLLEKCRPSHFDFSGALVHHEKPSGNELSFDPSCPKCVIPKAIALIRAAAPAGTARRSKLELSIAEECLKPAIDLLNDAIWDYRETVTIKRGDLNYAVELAREALATPSPQTPQEQSNTFSTTSAREQSSATASDSLNVAAQIILTQHWPSVRNMEENEARQREVKRIIEVIEQCTWQAAKEESDKWYEACRNPRADDPRAYCISKAVRK